MGLRDALPRPKGRPSTWTIRIPPGGPAMPVSLVISTYNDPQSLRRCLLGCLAQTVIPDQIIVADDGSRPETREVIHSRTFASLPLEHVWQSDDGWRRPRVVNLAMHHCTGDYVVFCDGDCIPRSDFIAAHLRHARPRTFVSGSIIDIPATLHTRFSDGEILDNSVFSPRVLEARCPQLAKFRRRLEPGRWEGLLNIATYRYCTLRGSNFSLWKEDFLTINGFDESFGYGSDDRELGVRLRNAGVASRWLKYSLVQLHLAHGRGPVDKARMHRQRWRFRRLFLTGQVRCEPGVDTAVARGLADPLGPYTHAVVHGPEHRATLPFPATTPPAARTHGTRRAA